MAFVISTKGKNGTAHKVRFSLGGRLRVISFGRKYRKQQVEEIAVFVQRIADCIETGSPPSKQLSAWLDSLTDDLRRRLERSDLLTPQDRNATEITIRQLYGSWLAYPFDRKESTLQNHETTFKRVCDFFDPDERTAGVTVERALEFRRYLLGTGKAPATVSGHVKNLRQWWNFAVKERLAASNPWNEVPRDSQRNPERGFYVTPEMYSALLDACPDQDWRTLIALCRIGGLRCDSETSRVRWIDVNWEKKTLLVHSPKTERYGKGFRLIPLFPELERELSRSWEESEVGAEFVLPRLRRRMNLRIQFTRIIFHAGLCPWERAFNNLRASRATELQQQFPAHVVAAWMGHSPEVAAGHYLMVRPEDVARGADTILKYSNPQPTPKKGKKKPKRSPIPCSEKSGTFSGPK